MKTRYSPLVKLKKSTMDRSERLVQQKNAELNNAIEALKNSYEFLEDIEQPSSGNINDLLASRRLLSSQRDLIDNNKNWVNFARDQLDDAKNQFKKDMIEYEKYKYLDLEEIKKYQKELKVKEAKDLDEVALMTYGKEYR
ncbi:flagellar export protein FliJ [Sulfurimonas sp.]|uniref:flagellar export protein FliJ n=1 Tax=Sulfurimonas sp. TaxID=2022749 RepID=UPI003569C994